MSAECTAILGRRCNGGGSSRLTISLTLALQRGGHAAESNILALSVGKKLEIQFLILTRYSAASLGTIKRDGKKKLFPKSITLSNRKLGNPDVRFLRCRVSLQLEIQRFILTPLCL